MILPTIARGAAAGADRPVWVTADDFGWSAEANAVIVRLARAGHLTAVSVMTHREARLEGLDELVELPVLVGLHVRLTATRAWAPSLGVLPSTWRSLAVRVGGAPHVPALAAEMRAQAERLAARTGRIDFVNAHEHVHLLPWIWPAALQLALEHRVVAIRCPRRVSFSRGPQGAVELAALASCARARPPPWLVCTAPLGIGRAGTLDEPTMEDLLRRPTGPAAVGELCLHPVAESGPTPELALIEGGGLARALARLGRRRATWPADVPTAPADG